MRFLTAVALALVMLWVPVDGVAQVCLGRTGSDSAMRPMVIAHGYGAAFGLISPSYWLDLEVEFPGDGRYEFGSDDSGDYYGFIWGRRVASSIRMGREVLRKGRFSLCLSGLATYMGPVISGLKIEKSYTNAFRQIIAREKERYPGDLVVEEGFSFAPSLDQSIRIWRSLSVGSSVRIRHHLINYDEIIPVVAWLDATPSRRSNIFGQRWREYIVNEKYSWTSLSLMPHLSVGIGQSWFIQLVIPPIVLWNSRDEDAYLECGCDTHDFGGLFAGFTIGE